MKIHVTIRIALEWLKILDSRAKAMGRTRSEYIRALIKKDIGNTPK